MSTLVLEAAPVTRPMTDVVGAVRTLLSLPARWESMGSGVGAVHVPVPARKGDEAPREVLVGDVDGLLTYADGASGSHVTAWMVGGYYDQDPRYSEEVPVTAGPYALAAAVRRAFLAARDAR